MQFPPWLQKGDKIILLATSGKINPEYSQKAAENLQEMGYQVEVFSTAISSNHYFSGTLLQRFTDLQKAISDPDCKAILCVRGGYGAIHLLDKLDWSGFMENPKWLIGFSDITLLHAAIQKKGFASIHGPMAKDFAVKNDDSMAVLKLLHGQHELFGWDGDVIKEGVAEGELIGGNLSLLASIVGSKWEPNWKGKILFVEDIGEYLYKLDRMLWTLKLRGVFNQISGLIMGHFSEISDTTIPYGETLNQIIKCIVEDLNIPVITGFPTGHEAPNKPIVLGAHVTLTVNDEKAVLNYKN